MKKSEQILLGLFLTLAIGASAFYLWKGFSGKLADLKDREHALALREAEIEVYLEEKDFWMARADWLNRTQPKPGSPDQVDNELVNLVRSPNLPGIRTENPKLLEPVTTGAYAQAGIEFTARGKLNDLFRWLHTIQKPSEFRAIRRLRVVPDKEEPELVVCDVELLRWYAPERP